MKKIIISGGGTGGHIYPAVAIANELKAIDSTNEILFVGAEGKMEMEKVPKAGYKIIGLPIAGINRSNMFANLGLPFKLIKSLWKTYRVIKEVTYVIINRNIGSHNRTKCTKYTRVSDTVSTLLETSINRWYITK